MIASGVATVYSANIGFNNGLARDQEITNEWWTFANADTSYSKTRTKRVKEFEITRSVNTGPAFIIKQGRYNSSQNKYELLDSSGTLYIRNNYLFGLKLSTDIIKLTEAGN